MSELVRPPASGQVTRASAIARPGASTADTEFNGSYTFDWNTSLSASITGLVPDPTADVAGCTVDDSDRVARHSRDTGEYYQRSTVWRATRAGITVLRLRRILRVAGPKKFAPTGAQTVETAEFFPASAPPNRRHGVVTDPPTATRSTSAGPSGKVEDLDYLPAAVRAELAALVPSPTFTHSRLLQYTTAEGIPNRHTLWLIRMDDTRAVVVDAVRTLDRWPGNATPALAQRLLSQVDWEVTRFSYLLGTPRPLAGHRPGAIGANTRPQLR